MPLHCGPTSSQPKCPGAAVKERRKQPVVQNGRGRRTQEAILEREAGLDQDAVCVGPPCSRERIHTLGCHVDWVAPQ